MLWFPLAVSQDPRALQAMQGCVAMTQGHPGWACLVARSFLRFREHIARAAHGDDPARMFRIVFDGGADARDMNVDRAIEGFQRFALE